MHPRLAVANGGETLGETKKLCISCKHTGRFEEQHVVSQQKYAYETSGTTFAAESKFGSSAALSTRTAKGEPKLTRVFNKLPQEKQSFAPETSYLAVQVHRKGVHRKGIKQHGRADKMASAPLSAAPNRSPPESAQQRKRSSLIRITLPRASKYWAGLSPW